MNKPFQILGLPGSLREASYNHAALLAAKELAPAEVSVEIATLAGVPPFNQDAEGQPPPAVVELKQKIRAADAILIATPEYNYSIPGVLKNAIDWASRPYGDSAWSGKPVAVLGASIGTLGTARAQYHLRQIFVFLDMHALNQPEVMIANAAQRFDDRGRLTDEKTRDLIGKQLQGLVALARQLSK